MPGPGGVVPFNCANWLTLPLLVNFRAPSPLLTVAQDSPRITDLRSLLWPIAASAIVSKSQ